MHNIEGARYFRSSKVREVPPNLGLVRSSFSALPLRKLFPTCTLSLYHLLQDGTVVRKWVWPPPNHKLPVTVSIQVKTSAVYMDVYVECRERERKGAGECYLPAHNDSINPLTSHPIPLTPTPFHPITPHLPTPSPLHS